VIGRTDSANALLEQAINQLSFSARAYDKVLRVARTLADLDGLETIADNHVSEAIQYRSLDRQTF
jgi:magnesium chelatase family protein